MPKKVVRKPIATSRNLQNETFENKSVAKTQLNDDVQEITMEHFLSFRNRFDHTLMPDYSLKQSMSQ